LEEERQSLPTYLKKEFPESVDVTRLMQYLKKLEVEEGYYLMRQGQPADGLYFIESGRVIAQIEAWIEDQSAAETFDSTSFKAIRLRSIRAGTVVGEVGMYLDIRRTASAVTTMPSTLYHLSAEALQEMEKNDPKLASAFHHFIARLLAERLADNNKTIQALND
jgi:SulP family sulfate permease